MAWYDTKEHCPEEPCPADQKVTAIEWNAMVTYLKDRICNVPLTVPAAGDDGKVIGYDHAGGKFDYVSGTIADPLTLGTLYVDYIFEKTADQGVNVEQVVFDDTVIRRNVDDNYLTIKGGTNPYCANIILTGQTSSWEPGSFVVYIPNATNDNLEAVMQAKGGVATPVLDVWKPIHVNEINEQDADSGVTVDGFEIKDNTIDGGAGSNKILIEREDLASLPALSEGELGLAKDTEGLYIGVASGNKRLDCSYFETIVPLAMNSLQTLTNTQADKAFIASNTKGATGLISTDDAKVQKAFLHLVGVATNTYAGENALDCTTGTHNQWQLNLDGGSYADLVNGASADGQMLDNDWKTYAQGGTQPFHFMFDVTSQITNIDGKIGITLQNGRSEQSSLNVTVNAFLRVLWLM